MPFFIMVKTDRNSSLAKYNLLFRLFGRERGVEILKLIKPIDEHILDLSRFHLEEIIGP